MVFAGVIAAAVVGAGVIVLCAVFIGAAISPFALIANFIHYELGMVLGASAFLVCVAGAMLRSL